MRPIILVYIGVVFHVLYIYSIFDIYFQSPLVHGMPLIHSPVTPPAKRLFLFVGDGLRADKFYEKDPETQEEISRAPYINSIIRDRGRYGVSHTHVPTESRPGHVALIAGFYEDVSAVTRGWKVNPVEFDSVFNRSTLTYAWGSPDIVPMFAKNAEHVHGDCYDSNEEDFAADASKYLLDTWVFEKVEGLFDAARTNTTLREIISQPGAVFFLHLLASDTNGHAFRPYSKEYLGGIGLLDAGIKRIERLVEAFFNDNATAYVFTADHGMSNKGSHGDGDPANTETPLVAWGSGVAAPDLVPENIAGPVADANCVHQCGGFSNAHMPCRVNPGSWTTGRARPYDMEQADVAALMSALIGSPFPVNSVGVVPRSYLSVSPKHGSEVMLGNAKQICASYNMKSQAKQESLIHFAPYPLLTPESELTQMGEIRNLIDSGEHLQAERNSRALSSACLDGIRYLMTYDWPMLMTVITLGYLGWMSVVATFVISHFTKNGLEASRSPESKAWHSTYDKPLAALWTFLFFLFGGYLWLNGHPIHYNLYSAFPVLFWGLASLQWPVILKLARRSKALSSTQSEEEGTRGGFRLNRLFSFGGYALAVQLLVIGYFHRSVFSAICVGMSVWPWLSRQVAVLSVHWRIKGAWLVSCLAMSVYTLLSAEYGGNTVLVILGSVVMVALSLMSQLGGLAFLTRGLRDEKRQQRDSRSGTAHTSSAVFGVLIIGIIVAAVFVADTQRRLDDRQSLPLVNTVIAWLMTVAAVVMPYWSGTHHFSRLAAVFMSLSIPMIFLSISYEVLFYATLCLLSLAWLLIERAILGDRARKNLLPSQEHDGVALRSLRAHDARTAFFFLFFIQLAFFGTGNVASISSFEISSTYRFVTVFSPFVMSALLIVKILIPFVVVSCVFVVLNRVMNLPTLSLFLVVIVLSDFMTMDFFFLVRDTGSWKDIGTSISHFVILNAMIIFILAIFGVAGLYMRGAKVPGSVENTGAKTR